MLCGRVSRVLLQQSLNKLEYTLPVFQQCRRYAEREWNQKEYIQSMVGNREQVCYGLNGQPTYVDRVDFPFPSIRYKEPTPDVLALRGKERGDWRQLTLEEKKLIYRSNFCLTFSEMKAPTGQWKKVLAGTLFVMCASIWMFIFQIVFVNDDLPNSFSPQSKRAQLGRMIDLQTNPITGLCSHWDYEKQEWKHKGLFIPTENPFRDANGNLVKEVIYH